MAASRTRRATQRLTKPLTNTPLSRRRTRVQRLVKPVSKSPLVSAVKKNVPEVHPPKAVKSGLAALGGAIGITAGSAAVSAARRRNE